MKTCKALRSEGFHSVTTIEFRLRTINYAEVQLDIPDFGSPDTPLKRRPITSATPVKITDTRSAASGGVTGISYDKGGGGSCTVVSETGLRENKGTCPSAVSTEQEVDAGATLSVAAGLTGMESSDTSHENTVASVGARDAIEGLTASSFDTSSAAGEKGVVGVEKNGVVKSDTAAAASYVSGSHKRHRGDEEGDVVCNTGRGRNERLQPKAAIRAAEAAAASAAAAGRGGKCKPPLKLVCAQPFPLMRGHTAFLTFATTPVAHPLAEIPVSLGATVEVELEREDSGVSTGIHLTSVAGEGTVSQPKGNSAGGGDMNVECERGQDRKA